MFSLICCVLAVSSVAFGESSYGYASSGLPSQTRFASQGYEQQTAGLQSNMASFQREAPMPQQPSFSGYGSYGAEKPTIRPDPVPQPERMIQTDRYGSQQTVFPSRTLSEIQRPMFEQPIVQETEADILCRGKLPETYIATNDGRGFIVCLEDGKGAEQRCPPNLWFHIESHKCEKKLGPLSDPCESQPCLNNGICGRIGNTFQCQCSAGFDGKNCELDARVCQTQQPCGQSGDVRCQSFRVGAALPYVCIFQNGRAYGPNGQQIQTSPCQGDDRPRPLFYSDKGFIYCDGELMFVESCAGGTIWDASRETCDWPEQRFIPKTFMEQPRSYGYAQQRAAPIQSGYSTQTRVEVAPVEQRRVMPSFEQPTVQSYGSYQKQIFPTKVVPAPQPTSRY